MTESLGKEATRKNRILFAFGGLVSRNQIILHSIPIFIGLCYSLKLNQNCSNYVQNSEITKIHIQLYCSDELNLSDSKKNSMKYEKRKIIILIRSIS